MILPQRSASDLTNLANSSGVSPLRHHGICRESHHHRTNNELVWRFCVEMATTPRLIDAGRFLFDSAAVRIGELAACDTR
jgi:hypothetical protein